jgi:hypothetical protein
LDMLFFGLASFLSKLFPCGSFWLLSQNIPILLTVRFCLVLSLAKNEALIFFLLIRARNDVGIWDECRRALRVRNLSPHALWGPANEPKIRV